MDCIYFPLTHVRRRDHNALAFFFHRLHILTAPCLISGGDSQVPSLAADGTRAPLEWLPLSIPEIPMNRARDRMRSFRQWADVTGGGPGQLRTLFSNPPAADAPASAIAGQLLRRSGFPPGDDISPGKDPEDAVVTALTFLGLAHERDFQSETIDQAMAQVDFIQGRLFEDLEGIRGAFRDSAGRNIPEDPGARMTERRIRAYVRVLQHLSWNRPSDTPVLWVTTSPSVLDFLAGISKNHDLVLDKGRINVHKETCTDGDGSGWQGWLTNQLLEMPEGVPYNAEEVSGASGMCPGKGEMTVHRFRGGVLHALFGRTGQGRPLKKESVSAQAVEIFVSLVGTDG